MEPKASPRADLSSVQLKRLAELLEAKRRELRGRLQAVRGRVAGDRESLADPVERAGESEEDAEQLGVADPDDRLLGQVEQALNRLGDGTYGVSELSGEPIGFERLQAVPWATLSASEAEADEARRRR